MEEILIWFKKRMCWEESGTEVKLNFQLWSPCNGITIDLCIEIA